MTPRKTPFAIVPIEAARDHRLTAMQYRVLIAILSFCARNSDTVYPKRATIASRCGYSLNAVTRATTQLAKLGWIEKTGKGGLSSPSMYRVTVPETLPEPETVADPETVAESGSKTVAGSDTATVAGSERGKEQTIEQTREQTQSSRFAEFWEAYPRKRAKKPAGEAWRRKGLDAKAERILSDIESRMHRDRSWLKGYIPNPTTYLDQERWDDEIEEERSSAGIPTAQPLGRVLDDASPV